MVAAQFISLEEYIRINLMGRPSKLNEQLIKDFERHTLEGLPRTKVCDLLGIVHMTMYNWIGVAESREELEGQQECDPELCRRFLYTLKRAEATWQSEQLEKMQNEDKDKWQMRMTLLERRDPKNWRRQDTLQVTDKPPRNPDELTDEQLAAIVKRG